MNRWNSFATAHPLVITEFGWPNPNDGTYNANLVAAAEQRQWGWIAYAWNGSTSGPFTLLSNVGPGANYDPAPAGVPVKQGMSITP
jgi:hypothetical protein